MTIAIVDYRFLESSRLKDLGRLETFTVHTHTTDNCVCPKVLPQIHVNAMEEFSEVIQEETARALRDFVLSVFTKASLC